MRYKNLCTPISVTRLEYRCILNTFVCVVDMLYNMLIQTLGVVEKTHDM